MVPTPLTDISLKPVSSQKGIRPVLELAWHVHDRLLPEGVGQLSKRHGVAVPTRDHLDRKLIFFDEFIHRRGKGRN